MPKGKKSKNRRKLATLRSPAGQAALAHGVIMFVPRKTIISRKIDTAIYLWFMEDDPVSIHVLACAAHHNLDEIATDEGKGLGPTMKNVWHDIYQMYDAFRHGTSDVDFCPKTTEDMLLDAVITFHRMYGFRTSYMSTFGSFLVLHSNLKREPDTAIFFENLFIKDVRHLSRQAFFERVMPIYATCEPTIRTRISCEVRSRFKH